jgi:hypothetical protein
LAANVTKQRPARYCTKIRTTHVSTPEPLEHIKARVEVVGKEAKDMHGGEHSVSTYSFEREHEHARIVDPVSIIPNTPCLIM